MEGEDNAVLKSLKTRNLDGRKKLARNRRIKKMGKGKSITKTRQEFWKL